MVLITLTLQPQASQLAAGAGHWPFHDSQCRSSFSSSCQPQGHRWPRRSCWLSSVIFWWQWGCIRDSNIATQSLTSSFLGLSLFNGSGPSLGQPPQPPFYLDLKQNRCLRLFSSSKVCFYTYMFGLTTLPVRWASGDGHRRQTIWKIDFSF